jgi:hypothetical protein
MSSQLERRRFRNTVFPSSNDPRRGFCGYICLANVIILTFYCLKGKTLSSVSAGVAALIYGPLNNYTATQGNITTVIIFNTQLSNIKLLPGIDNENALRDVLI